MSKQKLTSINYQNLIATNIREKYPYIVTGIVVLLLVATSLFRLTKQKQSGVADKNTKVIAQEEKKEDNKETKSKENGEKKYTVKKGDHLWKIAEDTYGSGYNAYDIAKANKISNPDLVYSGQSLVLPKVEPKKLTKGEIANAKTSQVKKKVDKYTVKKGDHLWKVATEVYGDGFSWVKIAKANNIKNPRLIYQGQVLKIQ